VGEAGPIVPGSGDGTIRPYRILDTAKRRRAGVVYIVMAVLAGAIAISTQIQPLWVTAVVPLVVLAGYQFLGGWKMQVTDMEAIEKASDRVSFTTGHGSATLGYRGLRARPVWEVLVYGDGPAPQFQALVTIDAVSGDVTGTFEEEVVRP
jgi:hypothetical protein